MPSRQFSLFPELRQDPTLREVADAIRDGGPDRLPAAHLRADQARYEEVRVRSALTRVEGMPFRWALNPYRGCTHACAYCYARKYHRHLELGPGDDFSSVILVKANLAEALARELARPAWPRDEVAVGTATDPYQPIEGTYRLTRRCLEVLADAATPCSIVTKGPLIVRDTDVLRRASAGAGCRIYVSVPTVDEDAAARLEPGTPPPAQRLRAVGDLLAAGLDASVLMMPLVPGITTGRRAVERTVAAIAATGARLAGAGVARLDAGVRGHFLAFLAREYPGLVDGYLRLYAKATAPAAYVRAVRGAVAAARAGPGAGGAASPRT